MKFTLAILISFNLFAFVYPKVKTTQSFEVKFGEVIHDQFKWMENEHDPTLGQWIFEQNNLTQNYLSDALLSELRSEFEEIYFPKNTRSSSFRYIEQDDYSKFRKPQLAENEEDKTTQEELKPYTAIQLSETGSDLKRLEIYKTRKLNILENGEMKEVISRELVEVLKIKFGEIIEWVSDDTFIYSTDLDERLGGTHPVILQHKIGTAQSDDIVIYRSLYPDKFPDLKKYGQQYYILQELDRQSELQDLYEFDMKTKELTNPHRLSGEIINTHYNDKTKKLTSYLIDRTQKSNGVFYVYDYSTRAKTILLEEQSFSLDTAFFYKGHYFIVGIDHAAHVLYKLNPQSNELVQIDLPYLGSVNINSAKDEDGKSFLSVGISTYMHPNTLAYRYDFKTNSLLQNWRIDQNEDQLEVDAKRLFYTGHDGKKIAMWAIYKKGLSLDTPRPLYLYGYGGFRINLLPRFRSDALPFIRRGGIFVTATLPGGLEYGEDWHKSGQLLMKYNTFDNFALAAKELIQRGLTTANQLAIGGGSNGGLLVTATMERYPSLFKAAVPEVGVHDLLNYHLFTAGKWWVYEYGNPDKEENFNFLFGLSPYHNLKKKKYPSTLVMTANFDDRVVPFHSYKYIARLQQVQDSQSPALLYVKKDGSHSSRSGSKAERLKQYSTKWGFLISELMN